MPSTKVTCPHCDARLMVGASPPAEKRLRCPQCGAVFTVPAPASDPPSAPGREPDSSARRPRRGPARPGRVRSKKPDTVGLVAAAVAVAVLLVAGASVGTYLFRKHRAATALEVARRAPAAGIDVGRVAREIEGEDIDGHRFRLSDYRGKVVLLDFWGNW